MVREIERLTQQEESMRNRNAVTVLQICRNGDLHALRRMSNTDILTTDSEGNNAVHWAVVSGNLEMIQYLIGLGVRGDLVNDNGQTPLHLAVMYGNSTLIEFLAMEVKLDLEVTDKSGKTPLQNTAENGDVTTLLELLKYIATIDQSLGVIAAQYDRHVYLQDVLTLYGVDHCHRNVEGKTCLMIAVENGNFNMIKFLMTIYKYDLRDVCYHNRSVFHYVADNGHADIAKYLLNEARILDIVPDVLNHNDYLLAIAKGNTEVARMFIEAHPDVESKDCFGKTQRPEMVSFFKGPEIQVTI